MAKFRRPAYTKYATYRTRANALREAAAVMAEQANILIEVARQARLRAAWPTVKARWIKEMARVTAKQPLTSAQREEII